jgi:branched-chain amino acid transport system substrate-binding protein
MLHNKKNLVFSLYIITLTLIGPLIFWLTSYGERSSVEQTKQESLGSKVDLKNSKTKNSRISTGNTVLVKADITPDKESGVKAFATGDYATAMAKFNSSLQIKRNDPESLIYWNNANALAVGNTVKIATSVPIGGNLNIAKEILRGIAQAQNEINRNGGIGGKLLQVEIANDDNDPDIAKQIASNFVKDKDIIAVIGHNSSEASMAAAPVYQKGSLVMMSPTSVARNLSGIGNYIFRTTPTSRATADHLARYVVNSAHKTKIAICSASNTQASESFKEDFTWAIFRYGGKAIETACDFSAPNFNPSDIPSQAVSDGANALLLAPSLQNINQALEIVGANKRRLTLLGSQAMYSFETLEEGQADANGMTLAVAWHPDTIPGNSFAFNARKYWGGSGSWRTAMAYDATNAIAEGLKSATTREQLQQTLSNPGFFLNGATGTIQFLPSGDRNMDGTLVKIQPNKNNNSEIRYSFVPLKE